MTREEALQKLQRYCDYQDRCHLDVERKLSALQVYGEDRDWVMAGLLATDQLNEERYARGLARGKFRIKGWGRLRILRELRARRIGEYLCRKALEEIDEQDYRDTLLRLLTRESDRLPAESHPAARRAALRDYALRKGYEPAVIDTLLPGLLAGMVSGPE
jgi:regulatory protein